LQVGVTVIENAKPIAVVTDIDGTLKALKVENLKGASEVIPAYSLFVATGTFPNNRLEEESLSSHPVSVFGDMDLAYGGSVVRAMASAKNGYVAISRKLCARPLHSVPPYLDEVKKDLSPVVHAVNRLTPRTLEIVIKAPWGARNFKPGQFYRLQNYGALASRIKETSLAFEGIALTGAWVDRKEGLIGLIILEEGGSTQLCSLLKKGEPICLMGPTGTPTKIEFGEKVCLIGGGLGNAVLFSIGKAFREKGSEVIYIAGYKEAEDVFYQDKIEEASDQVIWMTQFGATLNVHRSQDRAYLGNILDGMGHLNLSEIDRFLVIGSFGMIEAVQQYLRNKPLKRNVKIVASINAPMQCMIGGVCAQCLQRHVDPKTGQESYVYSCAQQDQPLMSVDCKHLKGRLSQNQCSERLSQWWSARCKSEVMEKKEA